MEAHIVICELRSHADNLGFGEYCYLFMGSGECSPHMCVGGGMTVFAHRGFGVSAVHNYICFC